MFKKPSKKQLLIRRIILSAIATLSVIIIVTAAVLFMLGYRLDSDSGRLSQGALLQFDSQPGGADVTVDGKYIGRTAAKHSVFAGVHSVTMSRAGYEDWSRTLDLSAGTLTWLDYTRLVPKNRPIQTVTTYETLVAMKISPDFKWAIAQQKTDTPEFNLVDLRSETVKETNLTLTPAMYADSDKEGVKHSFAVVGWDEGSRYALLKHLYSNKTEWLVLDTQDVSRTVNVTGLLSVGFRDVQFAGTDGRTLFGLTDDGTVRKIDLSAETISRALVTHVETFTVFDKSIISYVGTDSNDATKRVAGVYRDGDEAPHVLRSVAAADTDLKIATGKYFRDDFVAIAEGNIVTILKGSYPTSSSQDSSSLRVFADLKLLGPVSSLSFSPDGDYVLAQSGANFVSYEVEHRRSATGMVAVPDGSSAGKLQWLDDALLWSDDADTLVMRDFNGINIYSIMSVESGFDASLSQNGRFMYAVGKSDDGYHLQRVKMILD